MYQVAITTERAVVPGTQFLITTSTLSFEQYANPLLLFRLPTPPGFHITYIPKENLVYIYIYIYIVQIRIPTLLVALVGSETSKPNIEQLC